MDFKELVEYMVKCLVDSPDDVEIHEVEGEKSTILELKVKKEDIGKVIGKHGRIARAIRTILNASATKLGKKVVLEILD
ncbi:MAG: KH domain-containing protein [Spirochaetes bacterium]|nr:KH domain-containing protein [Spirochaetota bacterium]